MSGIRVLVCGGRDYSDEPAVARALDFVHFSNRGPIKALAHGKATGADTLADRWAHSNGVARYGFPADWKRHGKAAGPERNARMLEKFAPNLVVAFPGGKGTADMTAKARAAGVEVIEIPTTPAPKE